MSPAARLAGACSDQGWFVAQVHRVGGLKVPGQKSGQRQPENRLQFVRRVHVASIRTGSGDARARQ